MFYTPQLSLPIYSFGRMTSLNMATAVQHLQEADPELQVLGAAYIQHTCYNDSDAKVEVFKQNKLWVKIPLGVSSPH